MNDTAPPFLYMNKSSTSAMLRKKVSHIHSNLWSIKNQWSLALTILFNVFSISLSTYSLSTHIRIKSLLTASVWLSAYAHLLQTHRLTPKTGHGGSGVRALTDRQMDGRMDARYQVHYLPALLSYPVDNKNWAIPFFYPYPPMDDPHVWNIKSIDLPMDELIKNPAGNPTSSIAI